MGLSGQQRKQLQVALIGAFPNTASLEQMLVFGLDKNLRAIVGEGSLQDIVFQLIQTAEAQGWLVKLVRAARQENPGNSELEAITLKLLPPELPIQSQQKISGNDDVFIVNQHYSSTKYDNSNQFDVFLAHNTQDKPQVRVIAQELKRRGLKPWLDSEQIPPGRPFQDEIQKAISLVKSAAILIGSQGLGKWQGMELRSLISKFVDKNISVIPVLLPSVNEIPDNLSFLKEFNYVSFQQIDDENALHSLVWGITGLKPETIVKVIPQQSDDLSSDEESHTQYLYTQLQYFLEAKNWPEADQQTTKLMLNIAKREKEGYLDYNSINTFSCPNLKRIDQLWVINSNKRFGFSVQKEIWIQTGNRLGVRPEEWSDEDFENYERFSRVVGWYDDKVRVNETGSSGGFVSYDELLSRVKTNPFKSPRGSLPKNLAFNYEVSNQGVLFAYCDL